MQNFMENINKNLQRYESTIKKLKKKVVHLARDLADQKGNTPVMNDIPYASTSVQQECAMKLEPPQETLKMETFSEKDSFYEEVEFEVSLTHLHVVLRFCLAITNLVNRSQSSGVDAAKIISSTYSCTRSNSLPSLRMNKVESVTSENFRIFE
ncbi:hypothetical protein Tco_0218547 [Tanacetum coccineum]